MRVTSPNGLLDAVMIRKPYGGAAGGFEWYVSVVPTGKAVKLNGIVFQAGKLTGEKLVWNQAHLIEIQYDIALIEQFRNLWGLHEVQDVGSKGERDYEVEIRLAPSSQNFSVLTPDGRFR